MEIRVDTKDLKSVEKSLSRLKGSVPKVQIRALNKTLTGVKTDKSAAIREDLNLKKKYVGGHIKVYKAGGGKVGGRVSTTSKPVGLINFTGTRQIRKGVSIKVKKKGARKIISHAFIAAAKGSKQVFGREFKGTRKAFKPGFPYAALPRSYRYPIRRMAGPRLTDNLGKPAVIKKIEIRAGDRLIKNIDHEVTRELAKL